ncbi:SufS family cysteine desulfurase [Okibacterium endophyticum]
MTDERAATLRGDFPALRQQVNRHRLVYLDSGATSQKPVQVMDAERSFYERQNAAVHRGAHTLAAAATELFESARRTVSDFVGVRENEIVWTSNATEGINLIAYGMSNASLGRGRPDASRFVIGPGDEIVVTEGEHHANFVPWQELALRTGAVLRVLGVQDDGTIDLDDARAIIAPRTRVVAFTHVSNVTAVINPVADLVALAHEVGALAVLDACQSAPHLPLDLAGLDVDFAVFSGHKMLAPTGIGVLYGREELLNALPPFLTGGSMITTVSAEGTGYLPAPQRFEAGTQRVSQAIALAGAIDYLGDVGMQNIARWEHHLGERLLDGLMQIDGVRVLGPADASRRSGLVSFDVDGVHSHDVGQFLDDLGIAVRVGHHCAQPLHRRLGVTSSTRASAYLYNTTDDIDALLDGVRGIRSFFKVA